MHALRHEPRPNPRRTAMSSSTALDVPPPPPATALTSDVPPPPPATASTAVKHTPPPSGTPPVYDAVEEQNVMKMKAYEFDWNHPGHPRSTIYLWEDKKISFKYIDTAGQERECDRHGEWFEVPTDRGDRLHLYFHYCGPNSDGLRRHHVLKRRPRAVLISSRRGLRPEEPYWAGVCAIFLGVTQRSVSATPLHAPPPLISAEETLSMGRENFRNQWACLYQEFRMLADN